MWKTIDHNCRLLLGVLVFVLAFVTCSLVWGKQVTVLVDGRKYQIAQFGGTVSDTLNKAKVTLRGTDIVLPSKDALVSNGLQVRVIRVANDYTSVDEPVEFKTERNSDPRLSPGVEVTRQEGTPGVMRKHYRILYRDGQEISRYVEKTEIIQEAQPKVVAYGAPVIASRGRVRTVPISTEAPVVPSGNSRVIYALATAYTHTGSNTATGISPYRGVVSVDPRVIPLGTRVYVEGYGMAVAADTGGDIKGSRIDVFFETAQEALAWGKRNVQVQILE